MSSNLYALISSLFSLLYGSDCVPFLMLPSSVQRFSELSKIIVSSILCQHLFIFILFCQEQNKKEAMPTIHQRNNFKTSNRHIMPWSLGSCSHFAVTWVWIGSAFGSVPLSNAWTALLTSMLAVQQLTGAKLIVAISVRVSCFSTLCKFLAFTSCKLLAHCDFLRLSTDR